MKARIFAFAALAVATVAGSAAAQAGTQPEPKTVIARLAGTWSFEMFVRGRDNPFGKGRREIELLGDSLKLAWNDEFDGSSTTGSGFLGYDELESAYYLMSVQTDHPRPLFLLGSATTDTIRFDPARTAGAYGNPPGVYILSELRIVDQNRFEWVAINGEWRVEFTRVDGA